MMAQEAAAATDTQSIIAAKDAVLLLLGGAIALATSFVTNRQRSKHELEVLRMRLEHEEKERGLKLKIEKIDKSYEIISKLKEHIKNVHNLHIAYSKKWDELNIILDNFSNDVDCFYNLSCPYILEISERTNHIWELKRKLSARYYRLKVHYINASKVNIEDKDYVTFISCLKSLEARIEDTENELDNLVVSLKIVPTAPEFKRKIESQAEQPSSQSS